MEADRGNPAESVTSTTGGRQIDAGLYSLTATSSGGNNFAGSSSLPQDLSVVKVTSRAAIYTTADGGGYWLASATGAVNSYGDAPNDGGTVATHLNAPIVAATRW